MAEMGSVAGLFVVSLLMSMSAGNTPDLSGMPQGDDLFAPMKSSTPIVGTVMQVLDGDTLRIGAGDGRVVTVRLIGIDAPEKRQPGGMVAQMALAGAVYNRKVMVYAHGFDRYGRALGDVVDMRTGKSVNIGMVCAGFAWAAEAKYSPPARVVKCEAGARRAKLGIWAYRVKHTAPWKWRRMK